LRTTVRPSNDLVSPSTSIAMSGAAVMVAPLSA
jgi:hypothetical protein